RSCSATIRCAGVLTQNRPISEVTISPNPLASSVHAPIPQKWRRPVRQRSRLVRRAGPAHSRVEFAHPSEQEFARFLDYYRIRWLYEPVSFPIAWEGTRVAEMFTPDFYLPEHDLYIELTTMKQSLVTPKNRKLRMLRELYPELNVRLLYRKDYQQLLAKAGYGALEVQHLRKEDVGEILISPVELETRLRARLRAVGAAPPAAYLARGRDTARPPSSPHGQPAGALRRLPDPERLRGRLRAGLQGAVPQPAVHLHPSGQRVRHPDRAPGSDGLTGSAGPRLSRLLAWMATHDSSELIRGELLRDVEEIVVAAHRTLYRTEGRRWSKPAAYHWLRYEDPDPVARLADG